MLSYQQWARRQSFKCLRNGCNMLWRISAASAGDVDEPGFGEITQVLRHVLWTKVEPCGRKRIGQSRIWIAGDCDVRFLRELFKERIHQVWAERTVQPNGQRLDVLHGIPEGL